MTSHGILVSRPNLPNRACTTILALPARWRAAAAKAEAEEAGRVQMGFALDRATVEATEEAAGMAEAYTAAMEEAATEIQELKAGPHLTRF